MKTIPPMQWLARLGRGLAVCLPLLFVHAGAAVTPPPVPPIGANKFDLMTQYLGTASRCPQTEACRRVTQAMGRKAIQDARDAGIRFLRISTSGPITREADEGDSLVFWRNSPEEFWRRTDMMMDDLDRAGVQIVPVLMWGGKKFPVMVGETTAEMVTNPSSQSWQLLSRFVTEFVTRYRGRNTILFYELTNAFNKAGDLDHDKRCSRSRRALCESTGNFSTDQVIAFTERFAALLRRLDDRRLVSSGFAVPRPQAENLRAQPEWSPRGPNWTPDTREQFRKNLKDLHRHVDIVSIHLYGGDRNQRFGAGDVGELLAESKRVADEMGKPLFVGEFGEPEAAKASPQSHIARTIRKVQELKIPYAAVWVWEFYPQNTYSTQSNKASLMSVEPGYTDFVVDQIRNANLASAPALARPPAGDQPPRVVLTWPLDCAAITDKSRAYAVASDDSGRIARVEFWLGDRKLAEDTAIPYEAAIPAGVPPGEYGLKARAFDAAGQQAEFSSRVRVGEARAGGSCREARSRR